MTSDLSGIAPRVALTLAPFAYVLLVPLAQAQSTPLALERVVITANRTPQPLSSVLADISVIDRQDIEHAGVSGVAELLARLPGIEFSRNGGQGSSTSLFMRGGETRHTALYVDGVRVDSQATGGALWEQIPLDQIERIEVVRGPAAAVYGSDAVAGVVQLFTKRGKGAASPTASLTAGSYDTVQAQVGVSGSANALDYSLSAAQGRSAGFDATKDGAFGHNPDKDGWRRSSVQGRIGYQLSTEHRLDASILASNQTSGYDGSATTDDQSHHALRTGHLAWQGRWNADAATRMQVGETRTTYETQPSFYRTETTLHDYTLQHEQRLGSSLLTGTLERREDKLFNAATAFGGAFGGTRHQDALALGWRGDFGDHGLQAHVRHDYDSEFGGKNTGSIAWGWRFLAEWRVTASAGTSFRAPTLYQRFSEYGNPRLVPESGRNIELGLRWSNADHEASVTAWRNRVSHLIAFGSPGPCISTFGCYENVGRAQLEGITIAGKTQLAQITFRGSLDWHDPRSIDTDKVLQRRAKRLANLGAETVVAGWTIGAEAQAVGLRYNDAANTQTLGGYGVVNVYVSKSLMQGLSLEARVSNLGNKTYELVRDYATEGRNGQVTLRWAM